MIPQFFRCRTCGRYINPEEMIGRGYCSEDCAVVFKNCPNCGRYFAPDTGMDNGYCSPECSIHYQITKVQSGKTGLMLREG